MARPTKELEKKVEQRLNKFIPKILDWYEEVMGKQPEEMTYKDWQYLKYHISKVCLNKIIPDKKATEHIGEGGGPIIIKFDSSFKDDSSSPKTTRTGKK